MPRRKFRSRAHFESSAWGILNSGDPAGLMNFRWFDVDKNLIVISDGRVELQRWSDEETQHVKSICFSISVSAFSPSRSLYHFVMIVWDQSEVFTIIHETNYRKKMRGRGGGGVSTVASDTGVDPNVFFCPRSPYKISKKSPHVMLFCSAWM